MAFIPIMYRIKVKPDPVEEITAGGIILTPQVTDRDKAATVTGTVLAVGPSSFSGADVVSEGDRILFAKYGGLVHKENGEEFRFLNDEDIIAVERGAECQNQ